MKKVIGAAIILVLAVSACFAQTAVRQSGNVTPGHATKWITNGVIGDAGTAANGSLSSVGVTNNGGPGVCVNSAPITGPYSQLCLSTATTDVGKISLYAYGGATSDDIVFDINGSIFSIGDLTALNVPSWSQNILLNGDFSQWTLCPLYNCTLSQNNGSLSGQSGYPISVVVPVNVWPDGWSLSGTGYGGATSWQMRLFVPTSQTSVEAYPFRYSATTWTTAPNLGSYTEQPSVCPGPDPAFTGLTGCRNTYFDSQVAPGFVNLGMGQRTYTMSVNVRTGRRITNVANNGSGKCRYTVATTSGMTTAQSATIAGLVGTTACNGTGTITVVNGTTVDSSLSFGGSYDATNSDGLIANQPLYVAPVIYYSLGYPNWLVGQFPSLEGGYVQNSGSDGNFYVYQATSGTGTTGRPISAVANNGSGLCRVTVDSTANYSNGQTASTVTPGNPGCYSSSGITVIDATHIDLQTSTFSGSYTGGGYIGVPPVQITKGATQSDGNITWTNRGFAKGRTYDIYQGQYALNTITSSGYNIGAATATDGGSINPVGNSCAITATWKKCVVTILLPPAEYTNPGDYAWSGDNPRQLLPWVLYNGNAGIANGAAVVGGIDIIGPIGLQEVDLAELSAVPGLVSTQFRPPPKNYNVLTSLNLPDLIGYLPQTTTQKTGFFAQSRYNDQGNPSTFERRTITGTAPIVVTNGDGVSGNPTISFSQAWQAFTPSLSCGTGSLGTSTAAGRKQTVGNTVSFTLTVSIVTNSTCATSVIASIPTSLGSNIFVGRANSVSGKSLQGAVGPASPSMVIKNYDNSYPGADGETLVLTGTYEIQ